MASAEGVGKHIAKQDKKTEKAIAKHEKAVLAAVHATNPKSHHKKHGLAAKQMANSLDHVVQSIQDASSLFKTQSEMMLNGAL